MKNLLLIFTIAFTFLGCGEATDNKEGAQVALDAAGTYSGTGTATMFGSTENCTTVLMVLSASGTRFTIEERRIKCTNLESEVQEPINLEIRGNALFYRNSQVGTLTDTEFNLNYSQDGYKIAVRMVANNNSTYSYSESWSAADPQGNVQFRSTLTKR